MDVTTSTIASNTRVFLPSFPDINNLTVRGIVIQNYLTVAGQTDQVFLTLLDSKKNILLYNYPCQDLSDSSSTAVPTNQQQFFIRQFNLYDVETRASYINFAGLSGPITGLLFRIAFYI